MDSILTIDEEGTKKWISVEEDIYHREGGPAIETVWGEKFYIINGKYHREDGPAIDHTGLNPELRKEYRNFEMIVGPYDDVHHRTFWYWHGTQYCLPEELSSVPLRLFIGYFNWLRQHQGIEK